VCIRNPGQRSNGSSVLIAHSHKFVDSFGQVSDVTSQFTNLPCQLTDLTVVRLTRLHQKLDPFI